MPAPTNVRTVKTDIDGLFVKIAWDDSSAGIARYRFFSLGADGVTWFETPYTYDLASKVAIVPGGKAVRIQNVLTGGYQYFTDYMSVPAATTPAPPPVPPTEHQSLEAALGLTIADGSKVAVYEPGESGTDPAPGDWFSVGTPNIDPIADPVLPPPVVLSDKQKIEQALNITLATGDKVAIYPNPATVQNVNADGSVS